MFKSTADSQQRRLVISNSHEPDNIHGVDPTVWKEMTIRDQLVLGVKKLEQKASLLSAQIVDAELRYHGSIRGRIVPVETVARWKREKHQVSANLRDLQIQLANMKIEKRLRAEPRQLSLEKAFMKAAKMMLAGEVYERVLVAAAHMEADS